MKIAFLGTPDIALPTLALLHQHHDIVGVITAPDKPVGRKQILTPSPVADFAQQHNLKTFKPERKPTVDILEEIQPDICVVVAYGQILTDDFLHFAWQGSINIHFSLLPRFRGASPVQSAILAGDTQTGVTVQQMVYALDAGYILGEKTIPLTDTDTTSSLFEHLSHLGADLTLEVLKNPFSPQPQDPAGITKCGKFTKEDGLLDFTKSATQLDRTRRAFDIWPQTYTFWNGKRLKILDTFVSPESGTAGTVFEKENQILIGTGEGSLGIKSLQLEGKKQTDIKNFLAGNPDFIDAHLG